MAAQPSDSPKLNRPFCFLFNILTIKSHIGSAITALTQILSDKGPEHYDPDGRLGTLPIRNIRCLRDTAPLWAESEKRGGSHSTLLSQSIGISIIDSEV